MARDETRAAARFVVRPPGCAPFTIAVRGRGKWALCQLIQAGEWGCTPIKNPAPRWAAYVHALRELSVPIETIRERHGGDYPGHHARYVLRAVVQPSETENAA